MKEIIVRVSEQVHAAMMEMQRPDCNNVRIDVFGAFLDNVVLKRLPEGGKAEYVMTCDAVLHAWTMAKPSARQMIEEADAGLMQMQEAQKQMAQMQAEQEAEMGIALKPETPEG